MFLKDLFTKGEATLFSGWTANQIDDFFGWLFVILLIIGVGSVIAVFI